MTLTLLTVWVLVVLAAVTATGSVAGAVALTCRPLVAVVALAAVAVLVVTGSELLWQPDSRWNLDKERNLPTAFSVSVVGAAALAALTVGVLARRHGRPWGLTLAGLLLSAVLVVMAVDDWWVWHERLEGLGGLPWTFWYLPVPATAALSAAVLARALPHPARVLIALALLGWLVAGSVETFLWGSGERQDPRTMPVEEALEMLAPLALLIGLGRGVEHLTATSGSGSPPTPGSG